MFEDSLMENHIKTTSRLAVALSTGLQLGLVGVALLIPLLNYYELPATDLVGFLAAPPPPPPPPPPPAAVVKPQKVIPPRVRFGSVDAAPCRFPTRWRSSTKIISRPVPALPVLSAAFPAARSAGRSAGSSAASSPAPRRLPPRRPPPPPVKKKAAPKRIRVGGNVAKARLLRQVRPQYPPLARQARIQGTVKLSAVIAKDGTIQKLEVTNGHPLLVPAALAAVKQWRYKPTLLNGEAVEVLTNIDVNFTLSG